MVCHTHTLLGVLYCISSMCAGGMPRCYTITEWLTEDQLEIMMLSKALRSLDTDGARGPKTMMRFCQRITISGFDN